MHKLTKGLKKKKKGKKSKRKEEELFKPEELENYRKEHQGTSEEASAEKNEEWRKFLELTSGVDDILKKTQGDLDRIKSTSFFQRKPTESEVKNAKRLSDTQRHLQQQEQEKKQEKTPAPAPAQIGIVEVSESESEEEDDDNIFDTAYIDVITAGDVKLAYIPESPTEKLEGDDPFDTTIAERAILGPEVQRKGKKLVPIGAAVEVLTGRVQLPTCATKAPSNRRQVLKERDLLLGSFDDNVNIGINSDARPEEVPRTLLDDDPIILSGEPINLITPTNQITYNTNCCENINAKDIISEFDVIANVPEDPDDREFEALATESLSKTATVLKSLPLSSCSPAPVDNIIWNAFDEKRADDLVDDPFDTTFAENIVPVRSGLKIIEQGILNDGTGFSIQQTFTAQSRNIVDHARNRIPVRSEFPEHELNLIKPIHRDLLGGSNTDLSVINSQQLPLQDQVPSSRVDFSDPFDVSALTDKQSVTHTSVKQLLEESALSDDDFDPRGEENSEERSVSRPDVLNISGIKSVSFDVTSHNDANLLSVSEGSKIIKPLTPFYVRKRSVPEIPLDEDISDPFDTSFAVNLAPGKAELKVIESELFDPIIERELSIVDNDFDPRDERKAEIDKVVDIIKDITNIKLPTPTQTKADDLFAIADDIAVKVLTPGNENSPYSELSYCDPFDTSTIASNILPGKTELKLLETELIHCENTEIEKPLEDLLENQNDIIIAKPLSPSGDPTKLTIDDQDFDPFDTSIANNIQPGKVELKLLESEFIS